MIPPKKPRRDWRKELTGIIDLPLYRLAVKEPGFVASIIERNGSTLERYYTISRGQLADDKRRKWLRPRPLETRFDEWGNEYNGAYTRVTPLADGWMAPVFDITPQLAERKVRNG